MANLDLLISKSSGFGANVKGKQVKSSLVSVMQWVMTYFLAGRWGHPPLPHLDFEVSLTKQEPDISLSWLYLSHLTFFVHLKRTVVMACQCSAQMQRGLCALLAFSHFWHCLEEQRSSLSDGDRRRKVRQSQPSIPERPRWLPDIRAQQMLFACVMLSSWCILCSLIRAKELICFVFPWENCIPCFVKVLG